MEPVKQHLLNFRGGQSRTNNMCFRVVEGEFVWRMIII